MQGAVEHVETKPTETALSIIASFSNHHQPSSSNISAASFDSAYPTELVKADKYTFCHQFNLNSPASQGKICEKWKQLHQQLTKEINLQVLTLLFLCL